MKDGIYNHFHPEEKPFVDRVQEWVVRSAELHELKRTDFLDPRQAFIVTTLANRHGGLNIRFDGGHEQAERRRAIIAPDYRDVAYEEANLSVVEVTNLHANFADLDHGDFLGSIIGLGIKRDRIGDIYVHPTFCHVVATDEMAQYLDVHLRQVHRQDVFTAVLPIEDLKPVHQTLEEMSFTVASLRLDGIASDAYRISRAKIVEPIKAGKCRVNWRTEEDPSKALKEGDVISLKGLGRFKLLEVDGLTKKGRIRVRVGKFI